MSSAGLTLDADDRLLENGQVVATWYGELQLADHVDRCRYDELLDTVVRLHGGPDAHAAREAAWSDATRGPDRAQRVGLAELQADGSYLVRADNGRRWRVRDGVAVEVVVGRRDGHAAAPPSRQITVRLPEALHAAVVARLRSGETVAQGVVRLVRDGLDL